MNPNHHHPPSSSSSSPTIPCDPSAIGDLEHPLQIIHESFAGMMDYNASLPKRHLVRSACKHCRESHASCDHEKPCRRCIERGIECIVLVSHKRGRKKSSAGRTSSTSNVSTAESNMSTIHSNSNSMNTINAGMNEPPEGSCSSSPSSSSAASGINTASPVSPSLTETHAFDSMASNLNLAASSSSSSSATSSSVPFSSATSSAVIQTLVPYHAFRQVCQPEFLLQCKNLMLELAHRLSNAFLHADSLHSPSFHVMEEEAVLGSSNLRQYGVFYVTHHGGRIACADEAAYTAVFQHATNYMEYPVHAFIHTDHMDELFQIMYACEADLSRNMYQWLYPVHRRDIPLQWILSTSVLIRNDFGSVKAVLHLATPLEVHSVDHVSLDPSVPGSELIDEVRNLLRATRYGMDISMHEAPAYSTSSAADVAVTSAAPASGSTATTNSGERTSVEYNFCFEYFDPQNQ